MAIDIALIFNEIDKLIVERKLSKMDFYASIGYTQHGYDKMKTNKSVKLTTFFKICEVLGVNPVYFFDKKDDQKTDFKEKYYELLEKYNHCLELKLGK